MMNFPLIILIYLIITIVIEIVVGLLLKIRDKKDLLNIMLVNILTNPLVNSISTYILIKYNLLYRNISLAILEISACLIEGFIYKKVLKFKKINPYILSLILNLSSYLIGEIINRLVI